MIPDPDLQLQVVVKALREIVMPALDPAQSTAIEQLGLSIATLTMVRTRLPHISTREWIDLADAVALAHRVSAAARQVALVDAADAGQRLLETPCPAAGALDRARALILSAVSAAVIEAGEDDIDALMRLVIAGSEPSTDMARAWSKPAGFEPDPSDAPDLVTLMQDRIERHRQAKAASTRRIATTRQTE